MRMKNILMLAGVGVVLAGVVWYSFMRDKTPAPLLQTEDLTAASPVDGDVVATLLQLRAVTLSGTIFSDPAFLSLVDHGKEIIPEPVGRGNPFAPLTPAASPPGAPLNPSVPSRPGVPLQRSQNPPLR
jgi:hypothetical protein